MLALSGKLDVQVHLLSVPPDNSRRGRMLATPPATFGKKKGTPADPLLFRVALESLGFLAVAPAQERTERWTARPRILLDRGFMVVPPTAPIETGLT